MAASSRTTAGGSPDNACTQGVPARWAKQATDDMAGSERRSLVREWLSGESCAPVAGARDGGQGLRGREAYRRDGHDPTDCDERERWQQQRGQ